MHRRLQIIACSALAGLLVACGSTGARVVTTTNDADAQAFVNKSILDIFGHWNADALEQLGDPTVYDAVRMERARKNFAKLSNQLGPFVSYGGAQGKTEIRTERDGTETKRAHYGGKLKYRHGSLVVHMDAYKQRGAWIIRSATMQPLVNKKKR